MNKLVILREEETNAYYDPNKAGNGGGYHQPEYLFRYGSWNGYFRNTSCGGFGTRYYLKMEDGKHTFFASWGSMYNDIDSNFPEEFPEPDFYTDFKNQYGVKIPTEYYAMQKRYYNSSYSLEEYLEYGQPNIVAWNNDRLRREKSLKEEYGDAY